MAPYDCTMVFGPSPSGLSPEKARIEAATPRLLIGVGSPA